MQSVPQTEHHWLQKLVGEWTCESECAMGPDQPAMKVTGKEVVRTLGGLWTVGEGTNEHGGTSLLTIGYDEKQKAFVGTFIASMMSFLWVYRDGQLDETGKILTLNAEGPSFPDGKGMAQYQDIFEIVDENNRILSSRILLPDGNWQHFMKAHYKRVA